MYGITLSFVATRSGLTRFEDHRAEEERNVSGIETEFGDLYNRATDELFYRRAVDYYRFNSSAFVFSVPFNAGQKPDSYVLGSHALFFGAGNKKAPAAVVGLLFRHKSFAERFFNFSTLCLKSNCKVNCSSSETDCFLLDNNGYVIVSEQHSHTGRFFSEVDSKMFRTMVEIGVYKEIEMFDYQSICKQAVREANPADYLKSPFSLLKNLFIWLWTQFSCILFDIYINSFHFLGASSSDFFHSGRDFEFAHGSDEFADNGKEKSMLPNKTQPYPCDKKFYLYEMQKMPSDEPITGDYPKCDICAEKYIIQPVPFTNLILVVMQAVCPCAAEIEKIVPKEIIYPGECALERLQVDRIRAPPNITCHNHHPEEQELKTCGSGWTIHPPNQPFVSILTISITVSHFVFIRHLLAANN
ncbi:voltage-dependent calcium channel subunit alpha-2/delta-3-like protein [Dinothrombium tinctorium]|uniref:Voltage-dependent calcium channel subunit alpha-2/delta-3-like protein n=1 Tax=Dinothrombium tinctorium TaxID=1965070 RepID=A0A443RMQ0_9ACAR|nr:voltage-dependent calcium channel subunit alpha-2/delta-3-like protein [Dinothrombium tinctorium]